MVLWETLTNIPSVCSVSWQGFEDTLDTIMEQVDEAVEVAPSEAVAATVPRSDGPIGSTGGPNGRSD